MVTVANASTFNLSDPLSSGGAVVSSDMSGIPASVAAMAMADFSTTTENACVNRAQPIGPLHPRMYLLMFYRHDIVSALHAAGYSTLPGPPNDWGELLRLLQSLQDAQREQQQQQQLTEQFRVGSNAAPPAGRRNASSLPPLPRYGLCVTPLPHCGRAGDLLSAIAASASQTGGTAQGYVFDTWQPPDVAAVRVMEAGWRYAAGMLRALMAHNAPPADAGRCEAVSERFTDGSCMVGNDAVWGTHALAFPYRNVRLLNGNGHCGLRTVLLVKGMSLRFSMPCVEFFTDCLPWLALPSGHV